jgi:hypothetical protein
MVIELAGDDFVGDLSDQIASFPGPKASARRSPWLPLF